MLDDELVAAEYGASDQQNVCSRLGGRVERWRVHHEGRLGVEPNRRVRKCLYRARNRDFVGRMGRTDLDVGGRACVVMVVFGTSELAELFEVVRRAGPVVGDGGPGPFAGRTVSEHQRAVHLTELGSAAPGGVQHRRMLNGQRRGDTVMEGFCDDTGHRTSVPSMYARGPRTEGNNAPADFARGRVGYGLPGTNGGREMSIATRCSKIKDRSGIPTWLLVAALVAVGVAGCGGGSSSSSSSASVSASETAIDHRLAAYFTAWNNAAGSWTKAYKSGNRAAFLRVQSRYTQSMTQALRGIQIAVSDLRAASDRGLARRVADATAAETAAIVEIDRAVLNNDTISERLGLQHLTAAARQKHNAG